MKRTFTFYRWLGTSLAVLCWLLVAGLPARAQQAEAIRQATQQALQTRAQWAGADIAAANFRISSAHTEPAGLLYAYPQQLQASIPVYNRVVTLVFKDGKLRHHAGEFLPAKAFAGQPTTPTVAAATAVVNALATTKARALEQPTATSPASGPEQQQTFAPAGVAHRPIEVRLVWATDKGTPRLAWNVNVELLATPDWLNIRVDATTGRVLGQDNWTVYEEATYPATAPVRQPVVAGASPARAPQALRHPSGAKSTQAVTPASYRVVPFANERPDVTTPRVDTNPWLRAGAGNPVTTYGWHSDGTTDYTYTRGNNVWAYKDSLNTDTGTLAYSTSSTGTGGSLVFNDIPDFTKVPTLGKNRRAAVTNLFYWNNLMHDVMYQYGFTEASGNFQASNIGRGGAGGDYVRAEAQDGGGTNNANFATPPDGISGRMQMYLFTGITPTYTITVTAPAAVAGNYVAVESGFSTNNKLATRGPISGQLALYADAGNLACTSTTTLLTGKIALLYRGNCDFVAKVKNAQLAGATAAIVINNAAGAPIVMGGTDNTITIPAVMISQADGATLVAQIANNVQVTLPKPAGVGPQLDGDYDSGVMSHEYGHGISTRLTGGGSNTSCLYNAEQAGEGWSDYFGLMMTTDWANTLTTDGTKARPVGAYVSGQAATGGGIRRYPYSTSLSVNPLTYANMAASTEVHNIGEIWCATLWDMTWNIIQMQGAIEPNLYNSASTGGNAVALNLVMQGLKLQPCQPGFLDSRDAILAADSLLYGGQYHCAIWGAFARRGMGFSAREGASTSATDQTVAYDIPGVTLRKHTTPLVGNQINITLSASCDCQPTSPVSITDQLPTGLQYVSSTGGTLSGSTVTFAGLSFAKGQQRTFQIVAQAATGASCAIAVPVNDDRETNIVGGFTPAVVTAGGNAAWAPTTARAHSGTTSWATSDPSASSDVTLTSGAFTPTGFSLLSFYHFFSTESIYDGGLVAISVNNGAWQDAANYFLQNGYNSVFATGTTSVGKPCFSGLSSKLSGAAAFQQSVLNLTSFSGQSIRVRFQFQSDAVNDYGALPGWFIDDILVQNGCGGLQQVQLLNSANAVTASYAQATFFTPIPAPTIITFTPPNGPVGTVVTITGTDLTGTTGVTFNGVAATTFANTSATVVTATVPTGATTGLITVTTAGGTATSTTNFTVTVPTAAPVVTTPANNQLLTTATPTYSGTAPAGSTVRVYVDGNLVGTIAALGNGTFSLPSATTLTQGSHQVYATAQGSGATVSPNSTTNTFTIDSVAPTVASLTSTAGTSGSSTGTTPLPFSVTFSESVTGFSAAGITVTNGSVVSGSLSGSGSGPYTFSVAPTTAGTATTVTIAANAAQDVAGNGNPASAAYSLTYVAPVTTLTWNGSLSQDWNTATNWTPNQVPTASTDALIPSSGVRFYPLAPATGATRNLTIQATPTNTFSLTQGAGTLTVNGNLTSSGTILKSAGTIAVTGNFTSTGTLTQSAGEVTVAGSLSNGGTITQSGGTLAVAGNLTNNGTFATSAGTVLLGAATGAASSAILGSVAVRFFNLTIQASGAQLATSAGASVRRVLTLTGSFATNGNVFTIESASTGDALVVNSGGVVTGTATVQRYIDPSLNRGLGYRQYAAPVSNTTVADLATPTGFTPVVNPAYNSAAAPTSVSPFPTVYGYDQSRLATTSNNLSAFDKGYVSPASLGDPLLVGRGYTVNINFDQLVDFQGTLTAGDQTLSLARNAGATAADAGWQLLGNPYPAPLDYSRTTTDRVNLDGAFYVFSSSSQYGGTYRPYTNGIGNPVIPMGQAFFVRVSTGATSGTMTFRNAHRLTAPSATTFQRTAETRPLVQLTLHGTGRPLTDELHVYFEQGASAGFDRAFDAEKLTNPSGLNLASSLSASQGLSIDGRAPLGTSQLVVPLTVGVPAAGSYSLSAAQLLNLSQVPVYLRDKQTGALIDLAQQPSYQFTVSNAAATSTGRFELVFSPQQPLATAPAALAEQVGLYPNPARTQVTLELPASLSRQPVTATLLDALGRVVRTQVLPAGSLTRNLPLTDLASGVYALRLATDQGQVVKKLTIE